VEAVVDEVDAVRFHGRLEDAQGRNYTCVAYSPTNRTGSELVELTTIGKGGKLIR